jgi:hypothetical protein
VDYNPFKSGWATQETVQEKKMMCEKCGKMHENGDECEMNDDEKNEAMDPVNKKELKGKHADRKDKDIDNDGVIGPSDKYLHKRRKAISKAMKSEETMVEASGKDIAKKMMGSKTMKSFASKVAKMRNVTKGDLEKMLPDYVSGADISKLFEGYYKDKQIKAQDKAMGAKPAPSAYAVETSKKKIKASKSSDKEGDVIMNPKMDSEKKAEQKESKIRSALKSVLESKDKRYEKAGPTETMKDMRKGKGAEDMMKDADAEIAKGPDAHLNEPEIDKKNFQNMTKNVPATKSRTNDNKQGDKKIVPGGTQFKDPAAMKPEETLTKADDNGGGFVKKESINYSIAGAYASMYRKDIE